jgi:hypothetical protein
MKTTNRTIRVAAAGLVLTHLGVSIVHGLAHQGAMVTLTGFGYVYVGIVITLSPLVAWALLFSRCQKVGAVLLTLSMLGSFGFGVWYHFLTFGTDNVAEVHGPWHTTFLWTAIGLAVLELVGVITGLWIYRAIGRTHEVG